MRGILSFAALLCFALPAWSAPFERAAVDLAAEARAAAGEGKLLAVLFEQDDCAYCHALRKDVLGRGEAAAFEGYFRTVSVSMDGTDAITTPTGESAPRAQWAASLGMIATPALGVFDGKGRLVYRHLGTLNTPDELILLGRYIHEEAYEAEPWASYLRARQGQTPSADAPARRGTRQPPHSH